MKLCIVGQGTGGNASIWFDYFNSTQSKYNPVKVTFICRTVRTLEAKFKIIAPYGTGKIPSFLYKLYAPFISRIGMKLIIKTLNAFNKFDALILQGNYSPALNLMIMKEFNCHTIINLYGSDFYRNYLLGGFSPKEKSNFVKVLKLADDIILNWDTIYDDFVSEFPEFIDKCSVKSWGVAESWIKRSEFSQNQLEDKLEALKWPKAEKVFLSARALYDYNNIDIVVESFCRAFDKNKNNKLYIVNGYGNHQAVIEKVNAIIDKFDAHDCVITKIGKWISDEELQLLYSRADYNFCFGSTDQLTVSIVYSFLSKTINILSPLKNYTSLIAKGYKTPLICKELSLESLIMNLEGLSSSHVSDAEKLKDFKMATIEFNMKETFKHYLDRVAMSNIEKD
jgi:glycosyltransferase involved in cell wall biosynthesis